MRLALHILGRELLAVTFDTSPVDGPDEAGPVEHDHLCAQVERAEPVRLGFHIPAIPSVEE